MNCSPWYSCTKQYYTLSMYDLQLRMDVSENQGDEDKET